MIRACVVLIAAILVLFCASTPASACYVCAAGVGCYEYDGETGGEFCYSGGGRCFISGSCSLHTESIHQVGALRVARPANPTLDDAIFVVQSLYKITTGMLIYR